MTYNALDNLENAKKLLEQLKLEEQDISSSLEYDHATSFCSDCPARIDGLEYNCCKQTGGWDEAHESDYDMHGTVRDLIAALGDYVKERTSDEVQS